MKKLSYYLVKDFCREGNHEYRDHTVLATFMKEAEVLKTKDSGEYVWEKAFLDWQFSIEGIVSDNEYYEGYWSDYRHVRIEDVSRIAEQDAKTLFKILHNSKHLRKYRMYYHEELETIIENAEEEA